MIINNIQSIQFMQNAGSRITEKGDDRVDAGKSPPSSQMSIITGSIGVSTQGIIAGINYIEEQLNNLLTSFPPFFPMGTYQRADLIKGIRSLEEQIGKSGGDESIKKVFSGKKLPENASDAEISASLERLLAARDKLTEKQPGNQPRVKPGSLLNISV